jgi:hypothetical protein
MDSDSRSVADKGVTGGQYRPKTGKTRKWLLSVENKELVSKSNEWLFEQTRQTPEANRKGKEPANQNAELYEKIIPCESSRAGDHAKRPSTRRALRLRDYAEP